MKRQWTMALAGAVLMVAGPALAEGDAAKGEKVFNRCKACHVVDSDKNRLGPHLQGLIGREAGAVEGFKYSEVMKSSGVVWDEANLDQWLAAPKTFMPGNRMTYPGLKKEQDRADVIAYLKQFSG